MYHEAEPESLKQAVRDTLHEGRHEYEAGELANSEMHDKTFTGIIGPFGVGKSVITDELIRLNAILKPALLSIDTTTTRDRKYGETSDPKGFKTADEGISFKYFRDAYDEQSMINYSVIPGGHIYGTFPEGFRGKYNIGPLLPSSIEQLSKAHFEKLNFVYIVTPGKLWKDFVNKSRRKMSKEDFKIRAEEARDSIQFALANYAILKFVENTEGEDGIQKAAKEIRNITLNQSKPAVSVEKAVEYLQSMLAVANEFTLE